MFPGGGRFPSSALFPDFFSLHEHGIGCCSCSRIPYGGRRGGLGDGDCAESFCGAGVPDADAIRRVLPDRVETSGSGLEDTEKDHFSGASGRASDGDHICIQHFCPVLYQCIRFRCHVCNIPGVRNDWMGGFRVSGRLDPVHGAYQYLL